MVFSSPTISLRSIVEDAQRRMAGSVIPWMLSRRTLWNEFRLESKSTIGVEFATRTLQNMLWYQLRAKVSGNGCRVARGWLVARVKLEKADDEESLSREIRQQLSKSHFLSSWISNNFFPVASYILKNVTALRLYVPKKAPNGVPGEIEAEGELNILDSEFEGICYISKEIEHASSTEMDVHAFSLALIKKLCTYRDFYYQKVLLMGPLAAFTMTHGVWLLVLKFICCTDSREEEEGIFMVLKRVEELFIALKKKETQNDHDFYIYISLLSSTVTRESRDNWKSMGSLYSLIKAMIEVGSLTHLIPKDLYYFIPDV